MTKNEAQIAQFERTLSNLKEVLDKVEHAGDDRAVFRDSAIQRFEIAFDVCWKTLKEYLFTEYGSTVASPKKSFEEAYKQGLITNDVAWLDMTDMRNETAHSYNEEFAEKVLEKLPATHDKMQELLWKLKK